ncbi:hypothetical protein [Methylocella sp. CPCC 101449]|uniref:hypothetical protein n=1 Tax=Methylocella sp. CPCC 101449 TaxID=2987531 RepID=UPI00288DED0F|nr:hypothetical protein [Methylocella sp. CPCC 101449]MDT2021826.1 hypothetical protein [Methylocella sp. CPCC 101449]
MCDYSLHSVASRPAKVGERLTSTRFPNTTTRGFAAVGDPETAVCLLPGTEIAFDKNVEFERGLFSTKKTGSASARFRQVNMEQPNCHHDALELSDGQIVLVTELRSGQFATVLQLPVTDQPEASPAKQPEVAPARETLDSLF